MIAGRKSGFANTNISNCETTPFDFHPEYSTAKPENGDLDFDGPPYRPDWPDGTSNHPSPILIGSVSRNGVGPSSFSLFGGYSTPYPSLQFETDIPASEVLSVPPCNTISGFGCVVPPVGAEFYPFYSQLGKGDDCRLTFGNDIPGRTTNDFGKDAQYGSPTARFGGTLASGPIPNPCSR
jgi:hypothetical protein